MEKRKENDKSVHINNDKMTKVKKKVKKTVKKKVDKKPVLNIEIDTTVFDLEGKFLLVKVGNEDSAATNEQIDSIRESLVELFEKNNINCAAYVTHHLVSMEIIGRLWNV